MRDTFLRILTDDEKNLLHLMLEDEGYTVPQIR